MNHDFVEMLSALSGEDADFLIVGAHALAAHGLPRATRDLDIWTSPFGDNPARVYRALARFGAPLDQVTVDDLTTPGTVFQIGVPPIRIDVMTSVDGVAFGDAWPARVLLQIAGLTVPVLSRHHLIQNKRAAGRPQDLVDLANLEHQDRSQ